MSKPQLIPARLGAHAALRTGQKIKIANTYGKQVIDFWALATASPTTYLSMSHTRVALQKLIPSTGDVLVSNRRQPMLSILEDTTPGIHDTLYAACDAERYAQLGVKDHHHSCSENLHDEAKKAGIELRDDWTPDPFNLFMNIPVGGLAREEGSGKLGAEPPTSEKGQYVVLEARCDCTVFMSACPQDLTPINAAGPMDAEFEVYSSHGQNLNRV